MATTKRLHLYPAGTPELVRTNQKDTYYNGYLGTLLSDITEPFLPRRYWLQWQRELQLMAELLYYSLTTFKGHQTLGEEYCNMVQVTAQQQYPSLLRRVASVSLHVIGRYALEKCLGFIKYRLARTNRKWLSNLIGTLEEVLGAANQLHLAIFYLYGVYQWIGKRATGIHYLMIQYDDWSPTSNPYRLLGLLILLQLVIRLGKFLQELLLRRPVTSNVLNSSEVGRQLDQEQEDEVMCEKLKCSLCFESCVSPSVLPCGHLYCWNCIIEWIRDTNQCPVCRRPVTPRELVPLQHFQLE